MVFFADKKVLWIHTSAYRGIKIARGYSGDRDQTAISRVLLLGYFCCSDALASPCESILVKSIRQTRFAHLF